jgi:hypothetical protein
MKKAVVLLSIVWLYFSPVFGSENIFETDSLDYFPTMILEAPLVIAPLSFYSPLFPDQALAPNLKTQHFIGGSYALYPNLKSNIAFEGTLMFSEYFRESWDRPYRPNVIPNDDATLALSSTSTVFSLGLKYVPRHWSSPIKPFAAAHIGRMWMRNSMDVTDCDDDDNDREMHEIFLRQNGFIYSFETGLEYDFGDTVFFLSFNHMASWDDFEYYDFESLQPVNSSPAAKSLVQQEEFRSDIVEFHKTAPRYRGRLSMMGLRFGVLFRVGI